MCKILPGSKKAVKPYSQDSSFVMTYRYVKDNNCVKCHQNAGYQGKSMALTQICALCAIWPWPWPVSRSWDTLGSYATTFVSFIKIQVTHEKLWSVTIFFLQYVLWPWTSRYDLESWYTLGVWKTIVSIIILVKELIEKLKPCQSLFMCALWLWHWRYMTFNLTYPWVMENNCSKCHRTPSWPWKGIAWTLITNYRYG